MITDIPHSPIHILGLGVEKCGTTSMHDYLAQHPEISVAPEVKETLYFNIHFEKTPTWYLGLYNLSGRKAFLDFTPSYFRSNIALDRIASFPSHKRFLFQMRQPLRRAWSFYLHDIFHHISRGERGFISEKARFSFRDLASTREEYYFQPYALASNELINRFGRDRILFLVLEEIVKDISTLRRSLVEHLDLSESGFPHEFPRSNQLSIPRFLQVATETVWETEFGCLHLQPGLYRCENGIPLLRLDLDSENACRALKLQDSYDLEVSATECEELFDTIFREDTEALERTFGRSFEVWQDQSTLRARFDDPLTQPENTVQPQEALQKLVLAFRAAGQQPEVEAVLGRLQDLRSTSG